MSGRKNKRAEDRVGERYGRLIIDSVERKDNRTYASCSCDCGNILYSRIDALQSGATVSCGCYSLELSAALNKSHGMWKSYTYQSWADLKGRCLNVAHIAYDSYKDKTVCEKWLTFEGFYEDMGERPKGSTLDRIDGNEGYYKANCRWACASVQAKNQKKRSIETSTSRFKGVGRDIRAKRTNGWFFTVTKHYKTIRKYCHSEEQAAACFNYGTTLLYDCKVELNQVDYILSDSEKSMVESLISKKFALNTTNKGD